MAVTVEQINGATRYAIDAYSYASYGVGWIQAGPFVPEEAEETLQEMTEANRNLIEKREQFASLLRFVEVAIVGSSVERATDKFPPRFRQLSGHRAAEAFFDEAHRAVRHVAYPKEMQQNEVAARHLALLTPALVELPWLIQAENRIAIRYVLDNPAAAKLYGEGEGGDADVLAALPDDVLSEIRGRSRKLLTMLWPKNGERSRTEKVEWLMNAWETRPDRDAFRKAVERLDEALRRQAEKLSAPTSVRLHEDRVTLSRNGQK